MQCFKWAYRWSCLPSFWRSAPCWKCMQTSCPIQTFSWPSPMAPARWTAWSGLWSITSLPSTKVAKVPLPRSPTTPSSERPSTALGMYPKRQRLRQQSQKKGVRVRPTATMSALWLSKFPIIHLCQASMQNARRDRCVLIRTCGPRASSWACPLASLWSEKVSFACLACIFTCPLLIIINVHSCARRESAPIGARWGIHLQSALCLRPLYPHCALGGTGRKGQCQLRQDGLLCSHHLPDKAFLWGQAAQVRIPLDHITWLHFPSLWDSIVFSM